jgi:glycosyltransferase involved in cell wall biosynthesis
MKIIIVSLNGMDNSGGVERVTYYLNEILSPYYDVRILTRLNFSFGKIDVLIQSMLLIFRLLFIPKKIVISNSWHSFFYPVDFSIHHGTTKGVMTAIPQLKNIANIVISFMERSSCLAAKNILAVSSRARREIIDFYHINPKKIKILNNFVNENVFFPAPIDGEQKDGLFSHEDNNDDYSKDIIIKILFSGRLEKRKGLDVIKNLSDVIETKKNYELIIACNTSLNIDLFKKNQKTRIATGLSINEMRTFYNQGNILFFPSLYEGFSMATLEALSCGLPVIGTEYAIQEELQHYKFVKVYNHFDMDMFFNQVDILVKTYGSKKDEIHEIIKKEFGYTQYEHNLLSLIKKAEK